MTTLLKNPFSPVLLVYPNDRVCGVDFRLENHEKIFGKWSAFFPENTENN